MVFETYDVQVTFTVGKLQVISLQEKYSKELSSYLNGRHVELYWKGRVGLYALLKSLGVGPGDEVVMPAFTCVVVPSAVLYLGAKPVFVDIQQDSFSSSFKAIAETVSNCTKVIICQNTFGLSFELEEIVAFAKSKEIYTIEDCTHGFGGTYNGASNGTFCDAAIYSTQWNKPFSTGIGGFVTVDDERIIERLTTVTTLATQPKVSEQIQLLFLYLARSTLVNRYTYWFMVRLYRLLSSKNIVVGSSSSEELEGTSQPESYFKRGGWVQALLGIRALKRLQYKLTKRRENGEIYTDALIRLGKNHVKSKFFENHSFLTYPLLVHDKMAFTELAQQNQVMLGDWFTSPLHPIKESLERWGLNVDCFPVALYCSEHIVNLPTHVEDPSTVLQFIELHSRQIIDG